ncbi:hypothetical protein [Pelagibacterium lentulum]|uniref:Uncharacterized protein n=1 Tax=Pelagibacterium lentulum TaxID=2029865 RepID=A0A916W3W4_9HYPH|nr:hypothetical protein [Pelagibacterium lentulum]GGA63720.1 hypothetical protein GCM10011499_37610 [Pelagibacterium lentulum]
MVLMLPAYAMTAAILPCCLQPMEKRKKISTPALVSALQDWHEAREKLLASGTPVEGAGNPASQPVSARPKGGGTDAQGGDK